MAQILGISPAHVTDIEKGKRAPSEDLMVRIATHYKLDIAVLRAGWAKPDAIVQEVASQDSVTAAKVPEFLRTARRLTPQQWDVLIAQAKGLSQAGERSASPATAKRPASLPTQPSPKGGDT
jgi:transcriptional regulator with XRE-family HTH domain